MAKINNTTTFPITAPALDDIVLGTDVSDTGNSADGETVNFKLDDIRKLAALSTADSVGSYAFLANYDGTVTTAGGVESGSNLRYFGIRDTQVNTAGNIYGSYVSGTWRCMGETNSSGGNNSSGTLWLRIS